MNDKDFIINVGPGGTFRPSGNFHTTPEDVDRMFDSLRQRSGPLKLAIHFHGGLVNERSGLDTARKMATHISEAGAIPVCFVWETGLMETVSTNLRMIGGTKLVSKLIKMLVKKIGKRIGVDLALGRGAGTEMSDQEIDNELSKAIPFDGYDTKLQNAQAQGRGVDLSTRFASLPALEADLEAEFKRYVDDDRDFKDAIVKSDLQVTQTTGFTSRGLITTAAFIKAAVEIAVRVIRRYRDNRHHDFYPTLIEEILRQFYVAEAGATVWNAMKVKADEMWFRSNGSTGNNQYAGRYFLDKLQVLAASREVTIDLIGHSAGSIAICNLIKHTAASFPALKYRNVIFLAPACTINLFNTEILGRPHLYSSFRMFTMSDENECADVLVPSLYTHSLLYLISGILEGGGKEFDEYILGMERFTRSARSPYNAVSYITATTQYLYASATDRLILSQTGTSSLLGLRTQSLKHGYFDDDEQTLESCKHIIAQ